MLALKSLKLRILIFTSISIMGLGKCDELSTFCYFHLFKFGILTLKIFMAFLQGSYFKLLSCKLSLPIEVSVKRGASVAI